MRRLRGALLLALLLAAPAAAQEGAFVPRATIVQINDVYRIDAVGNGEAGGIGRVSSLVERARRETGRPVAVLHAGDFIAPSLESRYFAGLQMIEALNYLHARAPLYAVPGNHEFEERESAMMAGALRASRFPWLASNLRLRTGDAATDDRLRGDTILELGGVRVGVFSLTFTDSPRAWAPFEPDFVAQAERAIERLERGGAEIIVGLTHLNLPDDRRIARLRRAHPRFQWIAGGHEHHLIHEPLTDSTALITKGDSNARRVWRVTLGESGGEPAVRAEPVTLDASVPIDPAYVRAINAKWGPELARRVPLFDEQLGTAAVVLDAEESTVRNVESNWGNYLTDLMRGAFPDVPADVAVLNGGAIRIDDTFRGPIRGEHIQRTFGFPTRVGLVWLRGSDLRQTILERSVAGSEGEGYFLQVSGVRFAFDRSRQVGSRVAQVEIGSGDSWAPLVDTRVYVVAVPDYLFAGGDLYHFKDRAILTVPPGPDLKLMALDAITAAHSRGESIAPRVEGRIREIGR